MPRFKTTRVINATGVAAMLLTLGACGAPSDPLSGEMSKREQMSREAVHKTTKEPRSKYVQ